MIAGLLLTLRQNKTSQQVSCCCSSSRSKDYIGSASPDPDIQHLAPPTWGADRGVATLLKHVNRCFWCSEFASSSRVFPATCPVIAHYWRKHQLGDALIRTTGSGTSWSTSPAVPTAPLTLTAWLLRACLSPVCMYSVTGTPSARCCHISGCHVSAELLPDNKRTRLDT